MSVTINGSGQVPVQVVSFSTVATTASTSTTWVPSAITASITPTNSANKILVLVSTTINGPTSSIAAVTVFRGATNLGATGVYGGSMSYAYYGGGSGSNGASFSCLDSPATTSSTIYTVNVSNQNTAGSVGVGGGYSTITLMEISGT